MAGLLEAWRPSPASRLCAASACQVGSASGLGMSLITGVPQALWGQRWGGGLSDDCQWSEEAGYHQGDRAVPSLREEPRFCGIWSNTYINTIYIITQGRLRPKDIHQVKTLPLNLNPEDKGSRQQAAAGRWEGADTTLSS